MAADVGRVLRLRTRLPPHYRLELAKIRFGAGIGRIDLQRSIEMGSCLVESSEECEEAPKQVMGRRVGWLQCERALRIHDSLLVVSVIVERRREIQLRVGIGRRPGRRSTECRDRLFEPPGCDQGDTEAREHTVVVRTNPQIFQAVGNGFLKFVSAEKRLGEQRVGVQTLHGGRVHRQHLLLLLDGFAPPLLLRERPAQQLPRRDGFDQIGLLA